jgi:excinuclease ABC subunit C
VEVASLAKERRSRGTVERVFVPGRSEPAPLPQESPESLYLQRIRDETHRFAVTYHRQLRKRRTLATGLEGIPGVGKARRQLLIDRFRTLDAIRAAGEEEIAAVVGEKLAGKVVEHLRRPPGEGPLEP